MPRVLLPSSSTTTGAASPSARSTRTTICAARSATAPVAPSSRSTIGSRPSIPFPPPSKTRYAAARWVADHGAEELGVDATRLAVGGDSAGGNLAAVVSQQAREEGGPAIAFQLLIYPGVDFGATHPSIEENAEAPVLTKEHILWFAKHYLQGQDIIDDPRVSPLRAESLADLPPALVQTAEFDPLRDEGTAYAEALRQAGTSVTHTNYEGQVHVFVQLAPILDDGRKAIEEASQALQQALG